jgi:hypothetical protein
VKVTFQSVLVDDGGGGGGGDKMPRVCIETILKYLRQ